MMRILLTFCLLIFIALQSGCEATSHVPALAMTGQGEQAITPWQHDVIIKSSYGKGTEQVWIYEPADPTPLMAPVIIFLHGWGEMNPIAYGAWIDHLARQGNIVIYPRYQTSMMSPASKFVEDSATAIRTAIDELKKEGRVTPNLSEVTYVGHSCGGLLSVNLAATAEQYNIPAPRAIMSVQPGNSLLFGMKDLSQIDPQTRLMIVVGEIDPIVGDMDAKNIFNQTPQLGPDMKQYVMLRSRTIDGKLIVAGHLAPMALHRQYDAHLVPSDRQQNSEEAVSSSSRLVKPWLVKPDAMDTLALWPLFDALRQATFSGGSVPDAMERAGRHQTWPTDDDGQPRALWEASSEIISMLRE